MMDGLIQTGGGMKPARMRFNKPLYDAIILGAVLLNGAIRWTYTIKLGYWDGRTDESTGGVWVDFPAGQTFTAWAEIEDSNIFTSGTGTIGTNNLADFTTGAINPAGGGTCKLLPLRDDGYGHCTVRPRFYGPTLGQTFTIIGQTSSAQ